MTKIRDLIESGRLSLDTIVLGDLPMTADGCVMGSLATVYCDCGGGLIGDCDTGAATAYLNEANGEEAIVPANECYSTEEAARTAACVQIGGGA